MHPLEHEITAITEQYQLGNISADEKNYLLQEIRDIKAAQECAGNEEAHKVYKNILGRCKGREEGASIDICTMANFDHFNDYLNNDPGSSYFVMYNLSDPQSPYQFHYESNQFMDKNDNQILD